MSKNLNLTDAQYLEAMDRLRSQVESEALKLDGFDCTAVGDKDTQCTWGLCGENPHVFPRAAFHLFPSQLPGRLSTKYTQPHHRCPFEDPKGKDQESGCFYRCRFFQGKQRPSIPVWVQWWREALVWSGVKGAKTR